MIEILRAKAKDLLNQNEVSLIIGYGESLHRISHGSVKRVVSPVFITEVDEVASLVWNEYCVHNLATYLTRKETKRHRRVAIAAKGCDIRAINVLIQENQILRDDLVIIGLACQGVVGNRDQKRAEKCYSCRVQVPHVYDTLIHFSGDGANRPGYSVNEQPKESWPQGLRKKINQLDRMSSIERWHYWLDQFSKCTRCYACRNICPLCYCEKCIADKSTPQWIEKSSLLPGNLSFHIMRAFHLTGRCINCGECERVCPRSLPLTVLNQKMAQIVKDIYHFEPGMEVEGKPLLGKFGPEDEQSLMSKVVTK
jgi:formate dehydrogenase subunit beta